MDKKLEEMKKQTDMMKRLVNVITQLLDNQNKLLCEQVVSINAIGDTLEFMSETMHKNK